MEGAICRTRRSDGRRERQELCMWKARKADVQEDPLGGCSSNMQEWKGGMKIVVCGGL